MKSKIHEHKKNNFKVVSKKLFLIITILFSITAFSQETYVYKGNGSVFDSKGQEVSPERIRNLFSDNAKVLELYNAGRSKKTVGNILLYGGLAIDVSYGIYALTRTNKVNGFNGYGNPVIENEKIAYEVFYFAGAMIITAIPIKIGFSNKIKKAVDLMNQPPPKPTSYIEETSIIVNQYGVGIAVRF